MDIHNWIMDIHYYRVYALLSFHMSQLIHIKKYLFKIWLGISDHLKVRVSYSKKSLKWNRVEGCYLQHGCYWWLGACLATGYLQQPWWEMVICKWLLVNILSSVLLTNIKAFSSPSSLCVCAETTNRNWSQLLVVVVVVVVVGGGGGGGGGAPEAWLTLGHAPLNSHRCCPTAVPSLVEHAFLYKLLGLGSNLVGEAPMGLPVPVPAVPPVPDQSVHPCSYPFRQKRGFFFNGKTQILEIKKKGVVFYF